MITFIGLAQKENTILLYFLHKKASSTFLKMVASEDGYQFQEKSQYVFVFDEKNREEKLFNWQRIQIVKQKTASLMLIQTKNKTRDYQIAISEDLLRWIKKEKITGLMQHSALIPDYKDKNRYGAYTGEKTISLVLSGNLTTWKMNQIVLEPRADFFDNKNLTVECVLQTKNGILLLYSVKKDVKDAPHYEIGGAIFDKKDPTKLLWRSDKPLWKSQTQFSNETLSFLGAAIVVDQLILYWNINDDTLFSVSCPNPGKYLGISEKEFSVKLTRSEQNPIIAPLPDKPWESRATFNSAAVYEDGKVHFVYRALGDSDLSVLGYATSRDGISIDERSELPIYLPREPFETPGNMKYQTFADHFQSGGGYGGIEDPRITKIDDRFYMTYVAFDGWSSPRVALTSISVDDFLNKRWETWEKPKLISAPGMVNKNAVIFPEKINGKYVIFHRVYPNILVDYVDDLKFNSYLKGDYFIPPRKNHWDSKKIGAGAPPIKTKDGWLFIYQSVGHQDSGRYKIGAMLLEANNPTKVLYRANNPIIAPDEYYENAGHKAGVVYPCGAVVKDGQLLVYYGGADTVVCAAEQNLDMFLEQLKYNQEPKLRRVKTPVFN